MHVDLDALLRSADVEDVVPADLGAGLSGKLGGQFEALADQAAGLPLGGFSGSVENLEIVAGARTFGGSAEVKLVAGASNVSVLAARVSSAELRVDVSLRVDESGRELALDFTVGGTDWEAFSKRFLPEVAPALQAQRVDLYLDPLAGSGNFTDISGYVRWSADAPDRVRVAVLGNLGAFEVFTSAGEFTMRPAAFGLATDGLEVCRGYLSLPIGAVRLGSWQAGEGELSLRLDGWAASALLKLGDDTFSLDHPSVPDAMRKSGEVHFTVQTKHLSGALVNAIAPGLLPSDLNFQGALDANGSLTLDEGELIDVAGEAEWEIASLQWPGKSLALHGFSGRAQLDSFVGGLPVGKSTLQINELDLAGLAFSQIDTGIQLKDTGVASVGKLCTQILGGKLEADAFDLNLATKVSDPIRIRLERIDLAELAAVVPQFEGELTGRGSGDLVLELTESGLRLKDGQLGLDEAIPARLSYSIRGLFTQGLEEGSSAYRQYRMAERALEDLSLTRFRVEFFPQGDATKPILVTFYGESNQNGTVIPLDYTLNVNVDDSASLIQLLQMMQQGELEIR